MNRTIISFIALSLVVFPLTGCSEKRPDGMPKLYPASITVTMDGTPLAAAMVQLYAEDSANSQWGPGGITTASGIAELQTNGRYQGAPLGVYKVAVSKQEMDKHPNPEWANLPPDDPNYRRYMQIAENLKAFEVVAPEFSQLSKTPLKIEITAKVKSYQIEVGKNPGAK